MDAALQDFLGNKPNLETPKPEPQPADTQEQAGEVVPEQTDGTPQVIRRISGKQRRASLEEYKEAFLTVPTIEDRKPVFLSRSTRDALDRIVRMFGERRCRDWWRTLPGSTLTPTERTSRHGVNSEN